MAWDKTKDVFALMVGHGISLDGSWDPGTVYGNYTEARLMLAITKVAVKYLRQSGVKVLTDADKNNNRNMTSCVAWANKQGAKYYMSVHCDWYKASKGIYPQYYSTAGKKMSDAIGKATAKTLGMYYKGALKRPDLYEVTATDMVAVLFETGSIKADLSYLTNPDKYGKALAKAICAFIGVSFVEAKKTAEKSTLDVSLPKRGYFTTGDTGSAVKKIQTWLNDHGYDCGSVDGIYGSKTAAAVKKFQKAYKLTADGELGQKTLAAMKLIK